MVTTGLDLGNCHIEQEIARLKNELQQMAAKMSKTGLITLNCEVSSPPSEPVALSNIRAKVKLIREDMILHGHIYNRHNRNISSYGYWAKHKARPAKYMISHDRAVATQTG